MYLNFPFCSLKYGAIIRTCGEGSLELIGQRTAAIESILIEPGYEFLGREENKQRARICFLLK